MIATHNPGKLVEMRDLLGAYGIEAVSAGELGLPEPEETGATFRANAGIKAQAAAKASNMACFADEFPDWRSMRSTASPASIRRAGPAPTRTFASP